MISTLGITSANKKSVSDMASALPDVSGTIAGWFRPLILIRVVTKQVDREAQTSEFQQKCMGVIQPFNAVDLKIKPEGQRTWIWKMLHTTPDVNLALGEDFKISDVKYRIMGNKNYDEYGYVYYELVQDYRG